MVRPQNGGQISNLGALALAVPMAAGILFADAVQGGTCTIPAGALNHGDTVECTGDFTGETYNVPNVTDVTVINHGAWSYSGDIPNTAGGILGPSSNTGHDHTGLTVINNGSVTWTNASADARPLASRTVAVVGTFMQSNSHGSTYVNNGSITGVGAANAQMTTLAGMGNVGRTGPLYSENNGKIHLDISAMQRGEALAMVVYGGNTIRMVNRGYISVVSGNLTGVGMDYSRHGTPSAYQTGSIDVDNRGIISVSATGGTAIGTGLFLTDTLAAPMLTDARVTNSGSIITSATTGAAHGVMIQSNNPAVPIEIINTGEITSTGESIFASATNVAPVYITNLGTLQGDVVTRTGADMYYQEGGELAGGLSLGAGSDSATFVSTNLSMTTVLDGGDDVSDADGSIDTLAFRRLSATLSGANLRNWERIVIDDDATISFDDAALETGSADTLGLSITNGGIAQVGPAFALTGNLFLGAGGVFQGAGGGNATYSISGNLVNAGSLDVSDGKAGDTVTVGGNYHGADGTIMLDSVLDGDASPTDRLVIQGDSTGTSLLRIRKAGGAGAQTVNGIKVVEVMGASDGTFALAGADYEHEGQPALVNGAYAYKLYKNGVSTPDDGDWYLRSSLLDTAAPDAGPVDKPLYQAGAPVYETYPGLLLGLTRLPTLQQRVGNRSWSGNGTLPPVPAGDGTAAQVEPGGMWARIEGDLLRITPRRSTADAKFHADTTKIQLGGDAVLAEKDGGKLVGGLSVHYSHGKAGIDSPHNAGGKGRIKTEGYGLGGTLTWYGRDGLYVDAQTQLTWFDSDLHYGGGRALKKNSKGFGFAQSIEAGRRIALGPSWSLTPQAQLTYGSVRFDRFTDAFGARVRLERGTSLQGRLGVMVAHERAGAQAGGGRMHFYGIANLVHEFLDGTKVKVADTTFVSRQERLWGEAGIGGSYNTKDDRVSVYGEALVRTSLAHAGANRGYKGIVGLRIRW